jgi:hypothetical protein
MRHTQRTGAITTSSTQQLAEQARSQIRNLTVDKTARELEADTVTLTDIHEPDEVGRTGPIPGAIQAPRGTLETGSSAATRLTDKPGWPHPQLRESLTREAEASRKTLQCCAPRAHREPRT